MKVRKNIRKNQIHKYYAPCLIWLQISNMYANFYPFHTTFDNVPRDGIHFSCQFIQMCKFKSMLVDKRDWSFFRVPIGSINLNC